MRGHALRSALARPQRKGAQLLYLPDREKLKAEFRREMQREGDKEGFPVVSELSEIELSTVEKLIDGNSQRMTCITACCFDVNGQVLDLQYVMPLGRYGFDDYLAGVRRLAVQAQQYSAKIAMARLMSDEALGAQ